MARPGFLSDRYELPEEPMKVCVLGLGRMGTAIAERLLEAGHEVALWNRTPGRASDLVSAGAVEVELQDAWQHAEVCVSMLADSDALMEVTLGSAGLLASDAGRGRLLVDMSTVSAHSSSAVAHAADAASVMYLRAPVSGNPGVVRAGNLTIIASGSNDAFAFGEAVLRDIGPNVFHAGQGEEARIIKLALNLMIAGTTQLLAECVALAEGHGVARSTLLEIVGASAVASPFVKYKVGPLLERNYSSTFTTRLMRKDLDLALEAAAGAGVPLPVTGVVQQLLQACISTGLGDLDFMSLLIRLQREAGQVPDGK
ncbi:NAD(P)-dependent oxidoreductase [Pimelobacter simplex]|uniref:NAD(P)-dependent oxidoreductase n=1 Tax=Nocardioides simplex TaxID=2045 RepID=UPI0019315F75|nr:NAD(P)-dependent oxidoreductase [Pimelobacter simplex]